MSKILDNNPTKLDNSNAFGDLIITRMAPGDQRVTIDFSYNRKSIKERVDFKIFLKDRQSNQEIYSKVSSGEFRSFSIDNLRNGVDYLVNIEAKENPSGEIVARSHTRLFQTGHVPGVVINYIHPDDYTYDSSGRSPASPSLVRLPDGGLLASHDIFWGLGGQNLTKVFESQDQGNTWKYKSDIYPCFWGKLFIHHNNLYMLGTSTEYGELLIFESKDWGSSWSEPTTIISGGSREEGGPHKAPMPVVSHNGRLWTAIDYGSWGIGGHDSGVVSVSIDADLMNAENWAVSPFLPYNPQWEGAIKGGKPGLLEGNVVVTPNGGLVNFLRYNTIGGIPDYGKAIMLNVDKDNPNAPLTFGKVIDFPGNMSKFTINYDEESKKYYSLVNRVTTDWRTQRNILTLISSTNLIDWHILRDVINYEDNGWWEDYTKVGFQYVDWIFDGDDILVASRTAISGAYNFHNANYMTFHRIRNFRR